MSDESLPENRTSGLKRIAIVGGGLVREFKTVNLKMFSIVCLSQVGSLNACYFAKKGYDVDVYEGREGLLVAVVIAWSYS